MTTLTKETMRQIAAVMSKAEFNAAFCEGREQEQARSVQAGVVAALLAILPPAEFRGLMADWEIDQIRLAEFLAIAGIKDNTTTIET